MIKKHLAIFIAVSSVFLVLFGCANMNGPNLLSPPNYNVSIKDLANGDRETFMKFYVDAVRVPMVRILANPQEFDGKKVTVAGVYSNAFEDTALYLNNESYRRLITENSVYITTNYTNKEELSKLDGHYVRVTGIYQAGKPNGSRFPSGYLHDVAPMSIADTLPLNRQKEKTKD